MQTELSGQKREMAGTAAVAGIALIIGFVIGGFVWPGDGIRRGADTAEEEPDRGAGIYLETSSAEPAASGAPAANSGPISRAGVRLAVGEQAAGSSVTLDEVSLDERSWIAVHEERDGKPGTILGARRLDVGSHSAALVKLLRATVAGGTYYAMVHRDDGDAAFDRVKDAPRLGENGAPAMVQFRTR